jgi:hypothetical protein
MYDMTVADAMKWLAEVRGIKISRRSFYNWLKVGIRGVKLQHHTIRNPRPTHKDRQMIVVNEDHLEKFLAAIGLG